MPKKNHYYQTIRRFQRSMRRLLDKPGSPIISITFSTKSGPTIVVTKNAGKKTS